LVFFFSFETDTDFYAKVLRPILAQWTLLWLFKHFVGAVKVSNEILLDYLQSLNIEQHREIIENGLVPESKKLLNLASSWITS